MMEWSEMESQERIFSLKKKNFSSLRQKLEVHKGNYVSKNEP